MSHPVDWKYVFARLHGGGRPPNIVISHGVNRDDNHTVPLSTDDEGQLIVAYPRGQGSFGNAMNNGTLADGESVTHTLRTNIHGITLGTLHAQTSSVLATPELLIEVSTEDDAFFPYGFVQAFERSGDVLFSTSPGMLVKPYKKVRLTNVSGAQLDDVFITFVGY